jgi:hypothetical protein
MSPTIFTLTEGLGAMTGDGPGILVTAIIGGAIIPRSAGRDRRSYRHSPRFYPAWALLNLHHLFRLSRLSPGQRAGRSPRQLSNDDLIILDGVRLRTPKRFAAP